MFDTDELSTLSKTLFIPLTVRAEESVKPNPTVIDKKAVEILRQCDASKALTDGGNIAAHGILARTQVIDAEVRRCLAEHPHAVIINLGAGLDTRFFRLDNGTVCWYDLDLPEVIALRSRFIPESERLRFLSRSVLDAAWPQEIKRTDGEKVLIIAEGLLMYFDQSEVKTIFRMLSQAFPGADMLFDVVHTYFVGKGISSDFRWGLDNARDIEALDKSITWLRSWSTGDLLKSRQSFMLRLMNVMPATKNRSQIIRVKLKG